jgi:uncharacterized protein YqfA (UPF0365 family)
MNCFFVTISIVAAIAIFAFFIFFQINIRHWMLQLFTGLRISRSQFRKSELDKPALDRVMVADVTLGQCDQYVEAERLFAHERRGGDTRAVAKAVQRAHKRGVKLEFDEVAAFDLKGIDVESAMESVITNPIGEIEIDGVRLRARSEAPIEAGSEVIIESASDTEVQVRKP